MINNTQRKKLDYFKKVGLKMFSACSFKSFELHTSVQDNRSDCKFSPLKTTNKGIKEELTVWDLLESGQLNGQLQPIEKINGKRIAKKGNKEKKAK